jgi:hypothetical protein
MEMMLSKGVSNIEVYIQEVDEELKTCKTKMDVKKLNLTTTKNIPHDSNSIQAHHESCEINERVRVVYPTMPTHVDEGTIEIVCLKSMSEFGVLLEFFAIDLILLSFELCDFKSCVSRIRIP